MYGDLNALRYKLYEVSIEQGIDVWFVCFDSVVILLSKWDFANQNPSKFEKTKKKEQKRYKSREVTSFKSNNHLRSQ